MSSKDPTLFTSTGPHAAAKPEPPRSTTIPILGPGPKGETPQQKVARLRAAARQSKLAQETTFDKVVLKGRVAADWLHKVTTLSLIGFTVIAGVVVAVSLGDMMVHNRRKRTEFFAVQAELHRRELEAANEALAAGTANEDQMLLLNRERAREEAERLKLAKKGVWARAKDALFAGKEMEEHKGGTFASEHSRAVPGGNGEGVLKAVENTVREGKEKAKREMDLHNFPPQKPMVGGPLDQLADRAASDVKNTTKSWTDWASRR